MIWNHYFKSLEGWRTKISDDNDGNYEYYGNGENRENGEKGKNDKNYENKASCGNDINVKKNVIGEIDQPWSKPFNHSEVIL